MKDIRNYHKEMDSRMFDFQDFYRQMAHRVSNDARLAEVGIADGASSIFLVETLVNMGKKHFVLEMIDNLAYGGPDQLQEILRNVTSADVTRWARLVPFDSLNASCRYPDNHFELVFIDSSHLLEPTKAEIRLWYHKVQVGGILAGHDYNDPENPGVGQAVREVIPLEILREEETEKGLGVLWVEKRAGQYIN